MALYSNLSPANGERSVDTTFGRDSYTDVAIDGGYQFLGDGTHTATVDAILTHEDQNLQASTALGASTAPNNHLNQVRLNLTYFYQSTYGHQFRMAEHLGQREPGSVCSRSRSAAAPTASRTATASSSRLTGCRSARTTPGAGPWPT